MGTNLGGKNPEPLHAVIMFESTTFVFHCPFSSPWITSADGTKCKFLIQLSWSICIWKTHLPTLNSKFSFSKTSVLLCSRVLNVPFKSWGNQCITHWKKPNWILLLFRGHSSHMWGNSPCAMHKCYVCIYIWHYWSVHCSVQQVNGRKSKPSCGRH